MKTKVLEAASFLKKLGFNVNKKTGVILGTGLHSLVKEVTIEAEVSFSEIPHFPEATIEFHKGKLIQGKLNGQPLLIASGRIHYYEGYSMEEVIFPTRVMHQLGISRLLISNAAGCMNLDWKKGELMLIEDHINLQPDNPLRSKNASEFGSIFVDMSQPYDENTNNQFIDIANKEGITLHTGTYVAITGPSLETKAEYRFLRNIGADVVGMSTVPEVIAANQLGLPVSAISILTDECDPNNLKKIDIPDIFASAEKGDKQLVCLYKALIK